MLMKRQPQPKFKWLALPVVLLSIGIGCTPAPAPSLRVLYQDDFTNPATGWPRLAEGNHTADYHPPDFYHLEVSAPNDSQTVSRELGFDNFTVETDVLVDHTSDATPGGDFRYGLAIRRSGDQFYAFTISPRTKTWQVLKSSSSGAVILAQGGDDSIHGLQARDNLRVDARGANFTFDVNGRVVTQISDSDYASGDVGFFVQTLDEALAHIHYDSLTIWEVEVATVAPATATVLPPDVLVHDDFTNPATGWPVDVKDDYALGYHPPDFYHIEIKKPMSRKNAFLDMSFDDITVVTEVLVDHTSDDTPSGEFRYGLVIRRSGERYYTFTISPRSKTWEVFKRSESGIQVLAKGTDDSIQGLTASDRLRVDASGANLTFHINEHVVSQVSDSDFTSGDVGFTVETFDEPLAHIHYDSLTIQEVEVPAVVPTATPVPSTPTPAPSPEPTLIPPPPGMALVPADYFQMGSSGGRADEAPEHPVLLDAFYIDVYEVTNAQYRECVSAGGCAEGGRRDSFDNYPVISVSWDEAVAYCTWAGKRLPTEAEWEFAASGRNNLTWPWGNTFDASLSAASARAVQPVGSYPGGVSPFGLFDMAGNVTEWVQDVYDPAFYANSPASNPVSTRGGNFRIYRGGSYDNPDGAAYTTSRRYTQNRTFKDVDVGFRCAQEAPEVTLPDDRAALVEEFCAVYAAYKPGASCP